MAEYSNLFVVLMGIGVVFFGLVCIIVLTTIMGKLMQPKKKAAEVTVAPQAVESPVAPNPVDEIKPEVIAAITAVLSAETGTTATGLSIVDIRKV